MDEKERTLLIELAKAVFALDTSPNSHEDLHAAFDAVMADEEPEHEDDGSRSLN